MWPVFEVSFTHLSNDITTAFYSISPHRFERLIATNFRNVDIKF